MDRLLSFDRLLPDFFEPIKGAQGANEVSAFGASVSIDSTNESKKQVNQTPLKVVIDAYFGTRLPRTGVFAALDSTKPVRFPPFQMEDCEIEFVELFNVEISEIYRELGRQYEQANDGQAWENMAENLEGKYHLSYSYDDIYEKLSGFSMEMLVKQNGVDDYQRITCLEFSSPEDAAWYAEQASQSGFLNQQFPFEPREIGEAVYFERSDAVKRRLKNALGTKKLKQRVFGSLDDFYLTCSPELFRGLADSFGMEHPIPEDLNLMVRRTIRQSAIEKEPFYIAYRSPIRMASGLVSQQYLLTFAERYRERPGFTHPDAPNTFEDRLLMTLRCRLYQAFVETVGETIVLSAMDDQALRIAIGCFEPKEEFEFLGSIPDLRDYLEDKNREKRE